MKYFFTLLLILSFYYQATYAQNLVPNPSFEDTVNCPYDQDQVYLSKGWSSYGQSSDYYNACDLTETVGVPYNDNGSGFQYAASGNAYCGVFTEAGIPNYREFIGRQLQSPLIPGNKYYASMKVNLANDANCASNNIGILFSTIPYTESASAPFNNFSQVINTSIISDTLNWIIVSGSFVADSVYKYIVIGNFFDDNHTATTILSGNSCNAYYYIDDVCVSPDSLGCDLNITGINKSINNYISVYPNPATDKLYIANAPDKVLNGCLLLNLLGQTIRVFKNQSVIDVSKIPDGVYIIQINYGDRSFQKKQVIIH